MLLILLMLKLRTAPSLNPAASCHEDDVDICLSSLALLSLLSLSLS